MPHSSQNSNLLHGWMVYFLQIASSSISANPSILCRSWKSFSFKFQFVLVMLLVIYFTFGQTIHSIQFNSKYYSTTQEKAYASYIILRFNRKRYASCLIHPFVCFFAYSFYLDESFFGPRIGSIFWIILGFFLQECRRRFSLLLFYMRLQRRMIKLNF